MASRPRLSAMYSSLRYVAGVTRTWLSSTVRPWALAMVVAYAEADVLGDVVAREGDAAPVAEVLDLERPAALVDGDDRPAVVVMHLVGAPGP